MKRRLFTMFVLALTVVVHAGAQSRPLRLPEGHEFTSPDRFPFSLSADGTRLTYVARAMLFVGNVDGSGPPTAIQGPVEARNKANPIFSTDGRSIVYWAQDDSVLERVPVSGGAPQRIARVDQPLGMSWTTDGSLLVGQGAGGVVRVAASGGQPQTVVSVSADEVAMAPQLLPDGDHLLYSLGRGTPRRWSVVAQSIKTGARTIVASEGSSARYLSTGSLVYVAGGKVVVDRFDAATLTLAGRATTVAADVVVTASTGAAQFAVSDGGVLVVAPDEVAPVKMVLVALDGRRTDLGDVLSGSAAPRVSSDGKRVAFVNQPPGTRVRDIYVADLADVSHPRKVIADATFPVFSPDGQWLAFGSLNTAREGGEEALFIQRSDGSGEARLIAKPARAPENWRAGAQGFTFITHRGGANNYDLWAYNPDTKEVEPLVTIDETAQLSGAFSPDRKWFSYMSNESGDWQVWLQPYPRTGAKFQVTTTGGRSPMWLPDGRLVFEHRSGIATVTLQPGATPSVSQPEEHPISGFIQPLLRRSWDVTPDGRLLMLFRDGPRLDVITGVTRP